ncbi:hypothetical protein MSG28_000426 [Choristoneura fumiferana]|uniref:Uncharacterized protein n=1 Tax=Choristoneura fumiferana TaxID=7141 RepID=A0ACC0K0S4_CHOFU|nr:hypothetical protein MSG28_000426 [Choristoneura fumiferana]
MGRGGDDGGTGEWAAWAMLVSWCKGRARSAAACSAQGHDLELLPTLLCRHTAIHRLTALITFAALVENANNLVFECTWRGCGYITTSCTTIEAHIRLTHLGPKKAGESDHEEDFYYTEREVPAATAPPTLSHRDMCRPPHEDPDYQRQLVGSYRQGLLSTLQNGNARPISIPVSHSWSNSHSPKHMRLSAASSSPSSPGRRARSDNKKCRKVYGMDQRELWCTQCKWKKACTRFGD